jgi:hypothetical protein
MRHSRASDTARRRMRQKLHDPRQMREMAAGPDWRRSSRARVPSAMQVEKRPTRGHDVGPARSYPF